MSINRYAARTDANKKEIVRLFEQLGFTVYDLRMPCDLLVGRNGRNWLVEVKTKKGKLTEPQKRFEASWKGEKPYVVNSPEAVEAFVKVCC